MRQKPMNSIQGASRDWAMCLWRYENFAKSSLITAISSDVKSQESCIHPMLSHTAQTRLVLRCPPLLSRHKYRSKRRKMATKRPPKMLQKWRLLACQAPMKSLHPLGSGGTARHKSDTGAAYEHRISFGTNRNPVHGVRPESGMRRVTRLKEAIEQIISHLSGLPGE
jgi:hypothetical protein